MPSSDSITRKIALPKMWSKASVSPKNSAMKSCSVDAVSISSVATERKIDSYWSDALTAAAAPPG